MKRVLFLVLICGLAAYVPAVRAAEEGHQASNSENHQAEKSGEAGEEGEGGLQIWKWANFIILAGALGYLAGKNGGKFFDARSKQIRKDMVEAGDLRKQAEARSAQIEHRLANLEADVAALRVEAKAEAEAEGERISRLTAEETAKIQTHAEQEIAAAGKAARTELKSFAARLAVQAAEQKIRDRMTPAVQDVLVESFSGELAPPSSKAQTI